jgi:hypothetical protein
MSQQPIRTHTTDPAVLAAALREIADLILSAKVDTLTAPVDVRVSLFTHYDATDDQAREAVDQLAAVTGKPATDRGITDAKVWHETETTQGVWRLAAKAFLDRPVTRVEQLQAEVDKLRAQLAEQAAQTVRDVVDQGDEDDDCICLEVDGYHTCGTTINVFSDPAVRRAITDTTGGAQ